MSVSPTEHVIIDLGFHLTKTGKFNINVIRRGLKVATACALEANSPQEFRMLMNQRGTQIHNVPEEQLAAMLDN